MIVYFVAYIARWDTPNGVRADSLDDELLSIMIKSGLVNISIAAESGDDYILDKVINKHLKTKDVEKAAALADKYDLPCIVFCGWVFGRKNDQYR